MPANRPTLTAAQRTLLQLVAQERGLVTTAYMPGATANALRAAGLIDRAARLTPAGRRVAARLLADHGAPKQDSRAHSLGSGAKPPTLLA